MSFGEDIARRYIPSAENCPVSISRAIHGYFVVFWHNAAQYSAFYGAPRSLTRNRALHKNVRFTRCDPRRGEVNEKRSENTRRSLLAAAIISECKSDDAIGRPPIDRRSAR